MFERRTSIRSQAFSLLKCLHATRFDLLSVLTLTEKICLKFGRDYCPRKQKGHFWVDVHRCSKTSALELAKTRLRAFSPVSTRAAKPQASRCASESTIFEQRATVRSVYKYRRRSIINKIPVTRLISFLSSSIRAVCRWTVILQTHGVLTKAQCRIEVFFTLPSLFTRVFFNLPERKSLKHYDSVTRLCDPILK